MPRKRTSRKPSWVAIDIAKHRHEVLLESGPGSRRRIGFAHRVARQSLLARLEEVLAPAVVEVGHDALASAELGNTALAAQAFQDDPHFLLC